MKKDERKKMPIVFCPHCKKDTVAQMERFVHKDKKCEVWIICCPQCEYVLNLEKKIKIRWWLDKTVEKRLGWKRVK